MITLEKKRIYLDHAATSFPKPAEVLEAIHSYTNEIGASAGRGAYREAHHAKKLLDETRQLLSRFFNVSDSNRFIFTLNATDALNLALKGILSPGDHVVTSSIEHNSIGRPLLSLQERFDISFTKLRVGPEGEIDFNEFEKAIRPNTRLLIFVHGSNVSGTLTPIAEIGERARRHGIPLLVDAAQTAGSYPIDVEKMKIDLLAFPGHKGLLGPLGTGALWVRPGIDLKTVREGGTGSFSEEDRQPLTWPDIHESGSHNLVGIVGLKAALEFLLKQGVTKIRRHKEALTVQFLEGISPINSIRIVGPKKVHNNAGVVSLQFKGFSPQEVATRLDEEFRIQVRPGLHCAPWAHQTFQSYPEGAVRFSFGYSNSPQEIEKAIDAVRLISKE
jgi:cysteine desulfurase family protein